MDQRMIASGRKERFAEIDGLRGIAASIVLVFHYTHQFRERWSQPYSARYDLDMGYLGVHLFFVISGFVIYMTVLRSHNAWDFARKRILRLYPAYWICMSITFVVLQYGARFLAYAPPTVKEWLVGLTMLSHAFNVRWVDGAYWSLFIELNFYLFITVCLLSPLRKYARWLAPLWFAAMLVHHLWRPMPVISSLMVLHHGCFFLAGILFFRLRTGGKRDPGVHALLAGCFALGIYHFASTLVEGVFISLVFLVFWCYAYMDIAFLRNKVLLFLGWISYPLYLIHQEVGNSIIALSRAHGSTAPLDMILATGTVVIAATVITRYVEPWLKRKLAGLLGSDPGSVRRVSDPHTLST